MLPSFTPIEISLIASVISCLDEYAIATFRMDLHTEKNHQTLGNQSTTGWPKIVPRFCCFKIAPVMYCSLAMSNVSEFSKKEF